jgi:ornithine cyclodeaminase
MRFFDAGELAALLTGPALIAALREAFRQGASVPARHAHRIPVPGGSDATLLLMPAWQQGGRAGVKVVSVYPDNAARSLPSVQGLYVLLDAATGAPLAIMDGTALTRWRTGAASALAAGYLARPDAATLTMVGTGALAPHLVAAHGWARPLREVRVWGRDPAKARALAERLDAPGRRVLAAPDLERAVRDADIVSCATLARDPLIRGEWLRPGAHLDLVGGFTPEMREADDEAVRRARVYVDTREGALSEAGDVMQPIRAGLLSEADIAGDLAELARGLRPGRRSPDEITLFKSVGSALEDLAAARFAFERSGAADRDPSSV